jgi:AcrR family transcriptional regulator
MPKVSAQYLEARKNEILDAAFACFRRRGFHQTTMQDICKEAQLSPGAVYRYFRSKEDIIQAAIDRSTAEWAGLISTFRSEAPNPGDALDLMAGYFFGRLREPGVMQETRLDIETWPECLRDERLRTGIARQFATLRALFVQTFREAQADGYVKEGPSPEHLFDFVTSVYQGLRLNMLFEPETVNPDAVAQTLVELMRGPKSNPDSPAFKTEGD